MRADLERRTRMVRGFQEERIIVPARLNDLIDPARLGGSGRNGQVLNCRVIIEARFAGHEEHRIHPLPKRLLSRMLPVPPVAA